MAYAFNSITLYMKINEIITIINPEPIKAYFSYSFSTLSALTAMREPIKPDITIIIPIAVS